MRSPFQKNSGFPTTEDIKTWLAIGTVLQKGVRYQSLEREVDSVEKLENKTKIILKFLGAGNMISLGDVLKLLKKIQDRADQQKTQDDPDEETTQNQADKYKKGIVLEFLKTEYVVDQYRRRVISSDLPEILRQFLALEHKLDIISVFLETGNKIEFSDLQEILRQAPELTSGIINLINDPVVTKLLDIDNGLWVTENELKLYNVFRGSDSNLEQFKAKRIKGSELFKPLQDKMQELPQLTTDYTDRYQIGFIEELSDKEKQKRNLLFGDFLKKESAADTSDVRAIFDSIGIDYAEITEENLEKVANIINDPDGKRRLAEICSKPESIRKLMLITHSLNDGCQANFGNLFNLASIMCLCENPLDGLYLNFIETSLVFPILNSEQDVMLGSPNTFSVTKVANCLVSPKIFVQKLIDYISNLGSAKSWDMINEILGPDAAGEIIDMVCKTKDNNQTEIDKKAAEIVACLVIERNCSNQQKLVDLNWFKQTKNFIEESKKLATPDLPESSPLITSSSALIQKNIYTPNEYSPPRW